MLNKIASWPSFEFLRNMQENDIVVRLENVIPGFVSVPAVAVPRRKLYTTGSGVIPSDSNKGHFISLDLRSANFNTLKLLLPQLKEYTSWADFVQRCCPEDSSFSSELINLASNLKYLRAKTLGKVTPKRISFCQHLLMRFIFTKLMPLLGWVSNEHGPFLFTCDELIIPLAGTEIGHPEAMASVNWSLKEALPTNLIDIIRVELCSLERVYAPELMQQNHVTPSTSSSSSDTPTKPKNGGRQELMDGEFDGEITNDQNQQEDGADPPQFFYVRRGEDQKPQLKGLRSELRWEALKLANLFDPKVAFKAVTDEEEKSQQ